MDSAFLIPDDIEVIPSEVPDPNEPIEISCGNHLLELWDPIPKAPLGLQPLYDALPTWLGGYQRDGATRALTEMLRALKTAAESALEAEIDEVYISTPLPVHQQFNDRLTVASSALGFKQSSDAFWAATVLSKGSSPGCSYDEQPSGTPGVKELVLVLDHSHATLTATLGVTTGCLLDARRVLSSKDLGAWGLRNLDWCESDIEAVLERRHPMLVDALRRLIALPLETQWLGEQDIMAVDRVVLLGETANDETLHGSLREVFGQRLGALLEAGGWDSLAMEDEPLYTAAVNAAKCSLNNKGLHSERTEL